MTKNLLCLVLAFVMLFSFASCDGGNGGETKNNTSTISGENSENTVDESSDAASSEDTSEAPAAYEPLLYKVDSGNGNVLYIFGSIHVGDGRIDMLSDKIMNAYAASNYLCVEADIIAFSDDLTAAAKELQKLICPIGTTIKDQLGEELYAECKKYLEDCGYYNSFYDYYSATLWQSLVTEAIAEKSGLMSDHGADRLFLTMAHDEGMEIREIESASFQYSMMASFPVELMALMIEQSLQCEDEQIEALKETYDVWLSGDGAELEILFTDDVSDLNEEQLAMYESYTKAMLTDRNVTMTDKAEEYLEGGGVGFYVVGAAHVLGDDGIVAQLRDRGYTVTVVSGKE